jgi:hypothetical protein
MQRKHGAGLPTRTSQRQRNRSLRGLGECAQHQTRCDSWEVRGYCSGGLFRYCVVDSNDVPVGQASGYEAWLMHMELKGPQRQTFVGILTRTKHNSDPYELHCRMACVAPRTVDVSWILIALSCSSTSVEGGCEGWGPQETAHTSVSCLSG